MWCATIQIMQKKRIFWNNKQRNKHGLVQNDVAFLACFLPTQPDVFLTDFLPTQTNCASLTDFLQDQHVGLG